MRDLGFEKKVAKKRRKNIGAASNKSKNTSSPKDFCEKCGLYKQKLRNPKLDPFGEFRKEILIQGEAPGNDEDKLGEPFIGNSGQILRKHLKNQGIDLERDCITINSCDCRPMTGDGSNRTPTNGEVVCCYHRKVETYEKYKPKVIMLFGERAVRSFFGCDSFRSKALKTGKGDLLGIGSLRGYAIPCRELGAWVCTSYHPSFLLRGNQDREHIFEMDLAYFSKLIDRPRPSFKDYDKYIKVISEFDEAKNLLDDVWVDPFAFDYETSSFRYHEGIHTIHMISISKSVEETFVIPLDFVEEGDVHFWNERQYTQIIGWLKDILQGNAPKYAQNLKHEHLASSAVLGVEVNNWDHDTMVGAHVLNGESGLTGQKIQTYINWGFAYGGDEKKYLDAPHNKRNKFEQMPIKQSALYCGRDSQWCYRLVKKQKRELRVKKLEKAYKLLHDGSLTFAKVQRRGIRIDLELAKKWHVEWGERIENLKHDIFNSREAKRFERLKGRQIRYKKNISPKDLQIILYDILKLTPEKKTKTGYSTDKDVLEGFKDKCSFVAKELEVRQLGKMRNTYLHQFLQNEVDGFIYPNLNLHIPSSFRSSSNSPNFQNQQKRSEEGKRLRKLIIPRDDDHELLCGDYGAMEVAIIACVTQDAQLIHYIVNDIDFHALWTERIYKIRPEDTFIDIDGNEMSFKDLRSSLKNAAIFPWFYGSKYKAVAARCPIPQDFYPSLNASKRYLKWQTYIRSKEKEFWKEFNGVREWQDKSIEHFNRDGFIRDAAWGFMRYGYLTDFQIFNFPVQGSGFHCLLWSMINYENYEAEKFESLLCSQIHDEMFFDAKKGERSKLISTVSNIMEDRIREENPWIIVPLKSEWEVGKKDWYEMTEVDKEGREKDE